VNETIQKIKIDIIMIIKHCIFSFPTLDKVLIDILSIKLYDQDKSVIRKTLNTLSQFTNRNPSQMIFVLMILENNCFNRKMKNENTLDQFIAKFDLLTSFYDDIRDLEAMDSNNIEKLFKTLLLMIKSCFDK